MGDFKHFGKCTLILSRGKYFLIHIPLALSNLLELKEGDTLSIHLDASKGEILLKLDKDE